MPVVLISPAFQCVVRTLGQNDVVLEALLDEVQNLKNEISRISNKMNTLQAKLLEMDSRQRERTTREKGEIAAEIK